MQGKNGFTLIELLVVVVIIAILASIAMYNYMAAQTRSKVARAMADMGSIAVALESYRVDNADYPCENIASPLNETSSGLYSTPNRIKLFPLTTPISYINSLPVDPFASTEDPLNKLKPPTYHYAAFNDLLYPNNDFFFGNNPEHIQSQWVVQSNGPDKTPYPYQFPRYDPSNGTYSLGNILRFGP